MFRIYEGHSKSSKTNSKKRTSEYGNQIESCKYSHLIWLPYSEFFFLEFVLELFECPSYYGQSLEFACTRIQ